MTRADSASIGWPTSVVVVEVEDRRCGIPIGAIASLHRMVSVCPLPGAPRAIEGVIDLRGDLIGVLDLRTHLGLTHRPPAPEDHLVVLQLQSRGLALHVDRVTDFRRVAPPPSDDPGPAAPPLPASPEVMGVARLSDGLLVVHDVEAFLAHEAAEQFDEALQHHTAVHDAP